MNTPILRRKLSETEFADFPITGTKATVGRSKDCDIAIDDTSLSRLHMRIEKRNGTYFLVDNNSSNGTFLNRRKVSEGPLLNGDIIIAGRIHFTFHLEDMLEGSATRPMPAMTVSRTISANIEDFASIDSATPPAFNAPLMPPLPPPPPVAAVLPAPQPHVPVTPPVPSTPPPPPQAARPNAARATSTEETLEMTLRPSATPLQRFLAVLIDIGVSLVVMAPSFLFTIFDIPALGSLLGLLGAVALMVHSIGGWLKYRKTIGKHLMGIEIEELENPRGTGLEPKTILMRMLGMFLCSIPCSLGFLSIFFDPQYRGLHDKIANTRVIQVKR